MSVIEPFPPGHVETYKLDSGGRAFLEETVRYHKIGEPPAYTTFDVPLGMVEFHCLIRYSWFLIIAFKSIIPLWNIM